MCRLRYELARVEGSTDAHGEALFSLRQAQVAHPEELLQRVGVPLPASEATVLHKGLPWHCYQVRCACWLAGALCQMRALARQCT